MVTNIIYCKNVKVSIDLKEFIFNPLTDKYSNMVGFVKIPQIENQIQYLIFKMEKCQLQR